MQAIEVLPDESLKRSHHVKPLEGLSEYQRQEVETAMLKHFKATGGRALLIQFDHERHKSTFGLVKDGNNFIAGNIIPFEFSICNVCHTALCEHKEGRSDWPTK